MKKKDANIPANNASEKARKRLAEKIQRARQRVRWSEEDGQWVAEFVTKDQVNNERKAVKEEADAEWRDWCFHLTRKEIPEFPEPVTKAEAFAVWANKNYSWGSYTRWWDQHRQSTIEPRSVDEESEKRIKAELKTSQ